MGTPDADAAERARLVAELPTLELLPADWAAIEAAVDDVVSGETEALDRLSQLAFEARVAQRFHGGRSSSTLPPTKKVSALPWVGLVCGALVLAVGGSLGGGVVLGGVAVLSVGVFAVAFAGSRVAHRGRAGTSGPSSAAPGPQPVPIPPRLRGLVGLLADGDGP